LQPAQFLDAKWISQHKLRFLNINWFLQAVSSFLDDETAEAHISAPDETESSEPLPIAVRLTRDFPHLVRLTSISEAQ
jgi:hypothetical protein